MGGWLWRTEVYLEYCSRELFALGFETKSHLSMELMRQGWLVSEHQRHLCLCLPSTRTAPHPLALVIDGWRWNSGPQDWVASALSVERATFPALAHLLFADQTVLLPGRQGNTQPCHALGRGVLLSFLLQTLGSWELRMHAIPLYSCCSSPGQL